MGLKSIVFSLLPTSLQHNIIIKKTGFRFLEKANFTDTIQTEMFLPGGKQQTWINRFSKPYGHEPEVVKWYERHLKSNDVVYDIGAHMGYFAVLISKIKPGCQFHGFEANWFIAKYFKMNQQHHDKAGDWKLTEKFVGPVDNHKMVSIDTYMLNNPAPTIFQMDVDGEEINVLSGAKNLLARAQTTFIVEVHPKDLADRKQSESQFVALFDPAIYELSYLPNLRSDASKWADSISELDRKEEYYLCAKPKNS
jgi:Methyltransferase FkbM domain